MKRPYIIAEVGSNWKRKPFDEGMALAFRNIDDAALAGVSAVKFQLFTYKELYGIDPPNSEGDKYALPRKWLPILDNYCRTRGVDFLCSVFSVGGLKYLEEWVSPKFHKIASCEMIDIELVKAAVETGKPILISIGGSTEKERKTIQNYFYGEINAEPNLIFMGCAVKYPARISDYALHELGTSSLGLSDHTRTNTLAIAAAARGVWVFEKHFDALYEKDPRLCKKSPDSDVSIGPRQMRSYVKAIQATYKAWETKKVSSVAKEFHTQWRRRLKVSKPINSATDKLEYGVNFGSFRSLKDDTRAASPLDWHKFEGKLVKRDMKPQEGLWFDDIF